MERLVIPPLHQIGQQCTEMGKPWMGYGTIGMVRMTTLSLTQFSGIEMHVLHDFGGPRVGGSIARENNVKLEPLPLTLSWLILLPSG